MCARGGCCVFPWLSCPGRQRRSSSAGCEELPGLSISENLVFLHCKILWIKYDSFPFVCVHASWCLRCLCFCWVMVVLFQLMEECYSGKTPGWVEVSQIFIWLMAGEVCGDFNNSCDQQICCVCSLDRSILHLLISQLLNVYGNSCICLPLMLFRSP